MSYAPSSEWADMAEDINKLSKQDQSLNEKMDKRLKQESQCADDTSDKNSNLKSDKQITNLDDIKIEDLFGVDTSDFQIFGNQAERLIDEQLSIMPKDKDVLTD